MSEMRVCACERAKEGKMKSSKPAASCHGVTGSAVMTGRFFFFLADASAE
jgi:hypothetical protein